MNNTAMNTGIQVSVWVPTFNSFGYTPRTETAGSYGFMFNFLRNHQTVFYSGCIIFTFTPGIYAYSNFSTSLPNTCYSIFLNYSHRSWDEVTSHCSFYISLMTNDVEHIFMCLLAICISSLQKCQVLCPRLQLGCVYCWVVGVLCIF